MTEGNELQRWSANEPARRHPLSPSAERAGIARGAPGSRSGSHSEFSAYGEILRRRAPWAVGIFLVVVLGVLVGTLLQPPTYRAAALLEIRTHGVGVVSPDALFAPAAVSETSMRTQYGLLRSAALARQVIRELELHRLEEFRPIGRDSTSASDDALQAAVLEFQERLVVHPRADSRLVDVSFDYGDSELAARIVNAALTSYMNLRVDAGFEAARWLGAQMDSVRVQLRESEEALRAYAEENDLPYVVEEDVSPEIRARVRRIRDELADAEVRRYETESIYDLVAGQGVFMATGGRVMEDLTVRLADLKREYARVSTLFTDDYPEARQLGRQIEEVETLLAEERRQVAQRAESEFQVAARREELLREALGAEQSAADAVVQRSGTYHLLRTEVLASRELFRALQQKEMDARVSAALEATGVGIVDWAIPPGRPHRPVLILNLALGLIAGLTLGVGGAFLREYLDNTVQTAEEAGAVTGLPVLAMIPAARVPAGGGNGRVVGKSPGRLLLPEEGRRGETVLPPWPRIDRTGGSGGHHGALVEAFAGLRTSVLFSLEEPAPRSLLVSSCQPGDGKTTISLNLALSLKRLNQRVLLVNADMRRPGLHRALGIPSRPGLADHLANGEEWRSLVRVCGADGLHVLPSGGPVDNAGDLLATRRSAKLLREAEREYDIVVVDAPALFVNAPDARLLAEMVGGAVVVVRSGTTPRPLAERVVDAVPNVLGVIVNDVHPERLPEYYRSYFSPYTEPGERLREIPVSPEKGNGGRPGGTPGDTQGGIAAWEPYVPGALPEIRARGGEAPVVGIIPTTGARERDWSARAAVEVARECAAAGSRVVLADLSIDEPVLHRVLGEPNENGVTDAVRSGASFPSVIRSVADGEFHFAPAGTTAAEARAVLRRERWAAVVRRLAAERVSLLLYLPPELPGATEVLPLFSDIVILARSGEPSPLRGKDERVRAVLGPRADSPRRIGPERGRPARAASHRAWNGLDDGSMRGP